MELKEFVTETLIQLQEGVEDAVKRRSIVSVAGAINPVWGTSGNISERDRQDVEFDVAITVSDKSTATAKGGLKIFVAEPGGEGSKLAEQSSISRVKFKIPVIPPFQLVAHSKDYTRKLLYKDPNI